MGKVVRETIKEIQTIIEKPLPAPTFKPIAIETPPGELPRIRTRKDNSAAKKFIIQGIICLANGHRLYKQLGFKSAGELKAKLIDEVYKLQ